MAGTFDASVLDESLYNHGEPIRETGRKNGHAIDFTEVHGDNSLVLRFTSMTLDELNEELNRRIRETQKLQEEVDNATKVTLERFGCRYSINNSPGPSCLNYAFNALTQPQDYSLDLSNQNTGRSQINFPGKVTSQNAAEDSVQHLPKQQTQTLAEKEPFCFDNAIVNLQSKLHQAQMEKVILSDLRLNDSREHVDQMEQMLRMLEELQKIKRATDHELQEREDETLTLDMKVNTLEQMMKEAYSAMLSHKAQSRNSPTDRHSGQSPSANVNGETDRLQTADHMGINGNIANEQNQRMREMITDLCQEMALLSDKLNSSNHSSVSLSLKLELLRKLAERQTSLHQGQIIGLESALSNYKDKVCHLEEKLFEVQSQLLEAQTERESSLPQFEELQSQLNKLKRCSEQQQREFQVEAKALRGRLEEARDELHRAEEEKRCLQALLNERTQEGRKTQERLHEKEKELQLEKQEAQQHRSQFHTLQVEAEMLRLKLDDREKQVDRQKLQMESSNQMTTQQSRTIDHLRQDNELLSKQLKQHKLQLQQLKTELDQHRSDLAAAGHEKKLLQMCVSEQKQRFQEESVEKHQLSSQLEVQRKRHMSLSKEHEELQRLHSCKQGEQEGVVLRLQEQLRSTCEELDRLRSSLRTLEGAEGQGLRVAMDMQKEVTARREQADSLQSQIQHLEETVKELQQEQRRQCAQEQRQLQELTLVREEKEQLKRELDALRSKDRRLQGRINNLESILHKLSESFADCQDFIQLQEQDFYRLRLQHALDLKELQGRSLHAAVTVLPTDQDSLNPAVLGAPPFAQHACTTWMKVSHTQELRSLVRELQGVISENRGPHTDNSRPYRRRSAPPEKTHRTTLDDQTAGKKPRPRSRAKTCDGKPQSLKEAELEGKTVHEKTLGDGRAESSPGTSFLQYLSLGRRSPVHSLLTSNPNS